MAMTMVVVTQMTANADAYGERERACEFDPFPEAPGHPRRHALPLCADELICGFGHHAALAISLPALAATEAQKGEDREE
jgi:hypothetical protein